MNILTTTRRPVSNRRHKYVMEHRILSMIVSGVGLSLSLSSPPAQAQFCPLPALNPWCTALQTIDCVPTAADETCLPREVYFDDTGQLIILLCDCFGGTGCGPVDIQQKAGGYTVSCPGDCPPGQLCELHFNGAPTGMSSVNSSAIPPFTNVTCACVGPSVLLCPLPAFAECAALQSRDCPETDPATECLPKVIRHNIPPPPLFPSAGTDELSGTTGYVAIRSPSGQIMTYPIRESPPNTTRVMRESPVTYPEYHIIPTEIVAMELVGVAGGGGGGGAVVIRESPTRVSTGGVVGAVSDTTDYPADSFFDLFVTVDLPGLGVSGLYNDQAIRLEARGIMTVPPWGNDFTTPQGWEGVALLEAGGAPTDYVIVEVVHELQPPPPEWEVIECACIDPTACHVTRKLTVDPVCVGVCPPGQECVLSIISIDPNMVDYRCDCVPTEACCFVDGSCRDMLPTNCLLIGGSPQGPGTRCTAPEACCFPPPQPYCVDMMDPLCCVAQGGIPGGPNSTCAPEACCLPDGTCMMTWSCLCAFFGGTPQGPGTDCATGTVDCPQPEACCFVYGACEMMLPTTCLLIDGFPQGPGTVCSLVPEPCCLPDGTCQMVDPLCCDEMRGTPSPTGKVCGRDDNRNGIDDSCEVYENQVIADDFSVSCPECKCDLNLDGICDVNDRNFLISCSMPPPGIGCERADLNCNGFIDEGDSGILQCLLDGGPPPDCCPTPAPRPVINRLRWYGSYLDPDFEPPSIRQVDGWLVALHSDIPPVACPPPPDDTGAVDLCGTLKEGVEQGCILFGPDGSPFQYLVRGSVAPYGPGDRVRICGYYDPNCASTCMQGIGCIDVQAVMECDSGVSRPDRLLAQWLFPPKAVLEAPAGKIGCDLHQIYSYVTDLSAGCLIHNFLATDEYDPLTGTFYPRPGVTYWISFQAEVGITANPVTDCLPSKTGNQVRNDFWGWHTTPPGYGYRDDAYAGRLTMGCPGEWLYDWKKHLHWSQPPYVYCADDPTASIDMAFCLMTREIGPIAERLWWCQPVNPGPQPPPPGLSNVHDQWVVQGAIDTFADTTARVVLNLYAMGQVEVLLRGPTAVDRKKMEGTALEARIETEMIAMSLTGVSPMGPVTMREDPKRASLGVVTLSGGGGGGRIDSFFDVFVEIDAPAKACYGSKCPRPGEACGSDPECPPGCVCRREIWFAGPVQLGAQIYEVPPSMASFIGPTNGPVLLVDQGTGETIGELIYVQHDIGYRGGIDIQSDLDWTKVPTVPCCEPDPTGLGCNPVLLCPAHNQVCIPKAIFCTMPPPVWCKVIDCDCQNPDACYVELIDGAPRCVGTACSPGEVCNLSGTDTNGDGIVDRFVCSCEIPAVTPTGDPAPTAVDKNRHLSMVVPAVATAGPGPLTALRVTPIDLQNPNPPNLPQYPPPNFSGYESGTCAPMTCVEGLRNGLTCTIPADCPSPGVCTAAVENNGCARWVGKPGTFLESQDSGPGAGTYRAARLQCTPFYHAWGSEGVFHVAGAEIAPSSTYDVENLSASCLGTEDACAAVSPPLRLTTARSGDVEVPFQLPPPAPLSQPDVTDIAQLVNKFKNVAGAPVKAIAQLQPNLPELNADINALDIVAVVDAVKQLAYAYSGPCACPSAVTCGPAAGSVSCTAQTPCVTAFGAGSLCVKTCNGGANDGDPCINHTHCPGGLCGPTLKCAGGSNVGQACTSDANCPDSTCGTGFCRDRCGRCSP